MSPLLMTEKDWQTRVVDLARLCSWRIAHFRPAQTTKGWRTAMTGDPGWPDLVLLRPPRLIFAELKVKAQVRPEQEEWLTELALVGGAEVFVWRPDDWYQVIEVLR